MTFRRMVYVCAALLPLVAGGVAQAEVTNLKPHQAWSKAERAEAVLIDIRTPDEWRQTGVPRGAKRVALNDPRGEAGFVGAVMKAVRGDNRTPVALICRTGSRSAKAAAILDRAGFKTVYNVTEGVVGSGGETGWAARGLPMVACGVCAAQN